MCPSLRSPSPSPASNVTRRGVAAEMGKTCLTIPPASAHMAHRFRGPTWTHEGVLTR